jgi:hypothetical protein
MSRQYLPTALCCLVIAALATGSVSAQEKPHTGPPGSGRSERGEPGPDGEQPDGSENPGSSEQPGSSPGGDVPDTAGGEERYLARRVEVLRERLELTEQLGKLEVELLELQVQGHHRRSQHLLARQEVREQAVETAERNAAHREELRAKGVLPASGVEDARAAVGAARADLLELAVERDELETELASTKVAVKRREIEARLAVSAIRLELLEAEHQLETRRTFRERLSRGRSNDRGRDEGPRGGGDAAN